MNEYDIKIPIRLIILLSILLLAPYKSAINKRVYDPKANYQVLKKINRSDIETSDNTLIIYDKNFNVDFYNLKIELTHIKNLDKIIYLEIYGKDKEVNDEAYNSYIIINKGNKSFYYRGIIFEEISVKNYSNAIDEQLYFNSTLYQKKVKPFIPYFQTPKEFYNNFKEYFFPYYLGDYEVK